MNKQLSNQTVCFKKDLILLSIYQSSKDSVLGIMCCNFFSDDKRFSTCLLFSRILEQNLITKVINNQQQQTNILTYLKNSLFADAIVTEKIY